MQRAILLFGAPGASDAVEALSKALPVPDPADVRPSAVQGADKPAGAPLQKCALLFGPGIADLAKAHVGGYTRKDGTYVKEHEDNRQAAKPHPAGSKNPWTDEQWSKLYLHESNTNAKSHNKKIDAMRAHADAGDHEAISAMTHGSNTYGKRQAKIAEHLHGALKAAGHGSKPTDGGLHHSDLKEGDELVGPDGEKHEYSHTKQGLGRKQIETRAGHTFPAERDGTLKGWKKTGRNNMTGEGHEAAGAAKPAAKKSPAKKADPYGHPNVVGKAENLKGGDADDAHTIHFAGKEYLSTGKKGKSMHDGTPVRHFREVTGRDGAGEDVWMDGSSRVHADDTSTVGDLRKRYEAHAKKADKAPVTRTQNEGYGFHGESYTAAKETHPDNPDKEAGRRFSDAAHKLVQGGHFDSHEKARDYLDSTYGRHLHDSASEHDGDISKVPHLKKDVASYKKKVGKG